MTMPHAMTAPAPTVPSFYSQHGEDVVAWKVLAGSAGPRYFVEVGMIDGLRFSNTLAFERRGWRGLCIEAHPDFVDRVRHNRPNSRVIHAAVTDTGGGTLTFHADPRGDLSSLQARDPAELRERFGDWYRGMKPVAVPARTLDDILADANAPRGFELLSIDIEGGEMAALRGLDLAHWRPRLLIVEADDVNAQLELQGHLQRTGYTLARRVGVNAVFTRTRADAWRVRLARIDERVLRTAHPCDAGDRDAVIIPSEFETRSVYARRLLRTLARAA